MNFPFRRRPTAPALPRVPLEQDIVFTGDKVAFLDGRQTAFHLIR